MSWTYKLHLNSKRSDKLSKNTIFSLAQISVLHNSYFMFFPVAPSPTRDKLTSKPSSNSVLQPLLPVLLQFLLYSISIFITQQSAKSHNDSDTSGRARDAI